MALVLKDRVKETSTTAGTGTLTLAGAVSGFQSFAAVGNGNTTYYAIADSITGDWEVGVGTYTSSGTTLSRTTVLSSSNGGALVSFAANPKDVFVTYPSEKSVYEDAAGVVVQQSFGAITATSAALTTGTITTTPASNTDIVNKQYVDTLAASGIHFHQPVMVESPTNLNATYNNGTAGVGATLTNAGTQVELIIDGIFTSPGDRVLVYTQTNPIQNGIYVVTVVGTVSTNWVLTRASDADTYVINSANGLSEGSTVFVQLGATGAGETYTCNTSGVITFGTTAITFAQISSAQIYSAGTGLTLTSTQFSITPTGTAGTYGSASQVPVFVTNASGQVTSVTNTAIAINGSAVSGNISGSAGSVANALTLGTYLTGTSYNGSAAVTAAVDATSVNTASKVVARDASGNFAAGTITAALSGNATTATTATNTAGGAANQISYNTAAGTTSYIVAPTTAGTYLNWNGSAFAYTAIATPSSVTFNNGGSGDASGTSFNGSTARTISYNTVGAPSTGGTGATGTWGISISGNAATATSATSATSATTATNLAGGSAGTVPYQSAAGTTVQLAAGTSGYVLKSNGAAAPSWTAATISGVQLGSNLATLTMGVSGTGLSGSTTYNGSGAATFTVTSNATSANTASTIVARDASGNFSAGTITASLSGNATTATTAANVNNGTLTMNVSGTGLSGSQTFTANQSSAATFTVTSNATSANTASAIVARDASGNFSAGTITASLNGNASTSSSTSGNAATATALSSGQTNWVGTGVINNVVGMLAWKNYNNNHVIFDASAGTSPSGGAVNNTNAAVAWSSTYPTLMGWNGSSTYGVRVDSARIADSITSQANSATITASVAANGNQIVLRDANADDYRRYGFASYFNSSDDVSSGSISYVMAKFGDNYYRSASAARVATFISGQTMNINGSSTSCSGNAATATTATTATTANALNTGNNYQVNSLGVGTAGSGTAGQIRATNSVVAFYSSDIKFKENIQNIPNAAATAATIGGKLFDWTDAYIQSEGGEDGYFVVKADFGVIAQDVQKNFPRAVRTRPDGSLAVDYEKLSALALAAVAEHEDRIAKLEALVAKLIEG